MNLKKNTEGTNKSTHRVIHIVETLDKCAVENWLVRMMRHAEKKGIALDWTFFCLEGEGRLASDIQNLGGQIIYATTPLSRKRAFCKELRAVLSNGKFDVLHCHQDLLSAVYLIAAFQLPIRNRIIHIHNADEVVPVSGKWKQDLLREPLRRLCWILADKLAGVSAHTIERFRLGRSLRPNRDIVHYYGIDFAAAEESVDADRDKFRREMKFSSDTTIMLFAGRIDSAKNPLFAFKVFESLAKLDPKIVAIFAGTGQLAEELVAMAADSGLNDRFRYLGWRDDARRLMACSDIFILPHVESPKEGLGLAVVEAQVAGLPVLISTGVADDPILQSSAFEKLPLSAGPGFWAKAALRLLRLPRRSTVEAANALRASPFDMDFAIKDLQNLHSE